jgi:hypothetical protein
MGSRTCSLREKLGSQGEDLKYGGALGLGVAGKVAGYAMWLFMLGIVDSNSAEMLIDVRETQQEKIM